MPSRHAALVLLAVLACPPVVAGGQVVAAAVTVRASFYDAPRRSSFASRGVICRPRCGAVFEFRYRGRVARARCLDHCPTRPVDLSRDVAVRLGMLRAGVATVRARRVR